MRKTETRKPIWTKFCTMVDIPDIVTYTNFGDHRLRGFWVAGVKFPPLPLTFIVALKTTLALPCERVMWRAPIMRTSLSSPRVSGNATAAAWQ